MKHEELNLIVQRAMDGDKAALEKLFNIKGRGIFYLCIQHMGNAHDAEDAAQEVFIKIQKNISQLQAPQAFTIWLQKLIFTTCSNLRRKGMKKEYEASLDEFSNLLLDDEFNYIPQNYIEQDEKRAKVMEIVNQLPKNQRACIVLFYFENLTYNDISEVLNIPPATVSTNLQRAKKKIKEDITKYDPGAYAEERLPFHAIALLFRRDALERVPQAVLSKCIKVGLAGGTAARFRHEILNVALAVVGAAAVLITAIWVTGGDVLPETLSLGGGPLSAATMEAPSTPAEELPQIELESRPQSAYPDTQPEAVSSQTQRPATGGASRAVSQPGYTQPLVAGAVQGWLYQEQPSAPQGDMQLAVKGATVEMFNQSDPQTCVNRLSVDAGTGFAIPLPSAGTYLVRVTLPEGMRFATGGGTTGIQAEADAPHIGWLTVNGQTQLNCTGGTPPAEEFYIPVYYPATLTGKVLQTGQGADIGVKDMMVELVNAGGRVIMTATTQPDGSYTFDNPLILTGEYTLRLATPLPGTDGIRQIKLALAPGESRQGLDFLLSSGNLPRVEVALTGAHCECGHINPGQAAVTLHNAKPDTLRWRVAQAGSGAVAGQGSDEATLNELLAALPARGGEQYILTVWVEQDGKAVAQVKLELDIWAE